MEEIIFNKYQKFGEYFTGSKRKRTLYVGLLLIFIFLNYFSYSQKIILDTETLYWVFSSIVQALVSLVALMGVVSIFKLQNLKSDENRILNETSNPMNGYFVLLNDRYSTIESLKKATESYISNHKDIGDSHLIKMMEKRISESLFSKGIVVDFATKYSIYTFAVALISLLFLIFTPKISTFYLGINSLYLMFILVSYSLFLTAKGFSYSIRD